MWYLRLAGLYWALGMVERARLLQEHSLSGRNRAAETWILETSLAGSIREGKVSIHLKHPDGGRPAEALGLWHTSPELLRLHFIPFKWRQWCLSQNDVCQAITDPALHTKGESYWLFLCDFILNSQSFKNNLRHFALGRLNPPLYVWYKSLCLWKSLMTFLLSISFPLVEASHPFGLSQGRIRCLHLFLTPLPEIHACRRPVWTQASREEKRRKGKLVFTRCLGYRHHLPSEEGLPSLKAWF